MGLEQTTNSVSLHELSFERRTVLVVGNERRGLTEEELAEVDRVAAAEYFSSSDVIILTLGLSEVWYDKTTNEVYWRAVPLKDFDEEKHGFRVTTVEENKENRYLLSINIE